MPHEAASVAAAGILLPVQYDAPSDAAAAASHAAAAAATEVSMPQEAASDATAGKQLAMPHGAPSDIAAAAGTRLSIPHESASYACGGIQQWAAADPSNRLMMPMPHSVGDTNNRVYPTATGPALCNRNRCSCRKAFVQTASPPPNTVDTLPPGTLLSATHKPAPDAAAGSLQPASALDY